MPAIRRTYVDQDRAISRGMYQAMIDQRDEARAEVKRLEKSLTHTQEWYSTRWQRIADELRDTDVWPRIACIMANGTAEATEPPTYAQQMNLLKHQVERLRREVEIWHRERDEYRAEVERLREGIQRVIDEQPVADDEGVVTMVPWRLRLTALLMGREDDPRFNISAPDKDRYGAEA